MGPRGFNGTQGPKGEKGDIGPQGIGNVSACIMNKLPRKGTYINEQSIVTIQYAQRQVRSLNLSLNNYHYCISGSLILFLYI